MGKEAMGLCAWCAIRLYCHDFQKGAWTDECPRYEESICINCIERERCDSRSDECRWYEPEME